MNMKPRIIPFRVGRPIRDPANFIGRESILQEIAHAMLNFQNVSLHGERRTGKTSLLFYLAHSVSDIGLSETHVPVYFSFQDFAEASAASVWQAVANAIAEKITQRHPDQQADAERFLATVAEFLAPPKETALFGTGLGRALAHLDETGFKIHLLFDEFDQTARNPNLGDSFYDALRSLPIRAGNVSYVIATRTGLAVLQSTYDKVSSPFFNIFTTIILPPFREDEVHRLIFDYFARAKLPPSHAEKLCAESTFLRDVTGYHPFFFQTLCYHLCTRLNKPDWPLGEARREALQAFEKDSRVHFKFYWERSPKEEQELIKKLATRQSIDESLFGPAARSLQDRCLIVPAKSGWQLFSSAFGRWVREEITAEILNEEGDHQRPRVTAPPEELSRVELANREVQQQLEYVQRQEKLERLYSQGLGRTRKGAWKQAITKYEAVIEIDPSYKDAAMLLKVATIRLELQTLYADATTQLEVKEWKEAAKILGKIVFIDPTYKDSKAKFTHAKKQNGLQNLYGRVQNHFHKESWPQAINDLETIRQEDPDYLDIADKLVEAKKQEKLVTLYSAAVRLQAIGRWEKAIAKFQEILQVGSYKDVEHRLTETRRELQLEKLYRRREVSLRAKNWQEAVETFEKLRELDPTAASAITRLEEARGELVLDELYYEGMKFFRNKRWRKAKSAWETIIHLDPNYRDVASKLEITLEQLAPGKKFIELLRDLTWQGIGGAIAIIALIVAVYPLIQAILPTPIPKSATLCNGDFEDNFECWQHGGELNQAVECDGSQCFAVLGDPDYPCKGGVPVGEAWMKQSFEVPLESDFALSLRYRVFSYDLDLPGYDYFQVAINGEPFSQQYGNYEWNVPSCDLDPWDSGWQILTLDLSAYQGREVEVSFHNVNGTQPYHNTWTYVDTVKID